MATKSPDARLTALLPNLYTVEDTCNAYALVDGHCALVIDPGSGRICDLLKSVGVEQVEWVLHTHHHRDQCWGDQELLRAGARLAVPEYERFLFEQAETYWQTRRIFDTYSDRSSSFSIGTNLPVAATLDDYEVFIWRDYRFYVLPTKGHTLGSSSLIADVDGTRVAFTGDLIHGGGKLHQVHGLDYFHGDKAGVAFTLQSLRALRKHHPALVLPSHGPAIDDPRGDIDRLEERLFALLDLGLVALEAGAGTRDYLAAMPMFEASPHLLWGGPYTCSNFYVIKSDSGKALFIDYGHSLWASLHLSDAEPLERLRFIEHHLDELLEDHGITEFDVVIPTHVHSDHVCGIPYLQRHHGTRCWALREVGQVLQDPAAWSSTPGTIDRPIRIDRWLEDQETFTWEEYEFTVEFAPGQTEFHSLITTTIDGQTVAFTGDNYEEREVSVGAGRRETRPFLLMPFRDSFQFSTLRRVRRVIGDLQADLICPGHGELLHVDRSMLAVYGDFIARSETALRALGAGSPDQSVDLYWARLLPYYTRAARGDTISYRLLLRNNFDHELVVSARLLHPGDPPSNRRSEESGIVTLPRNGVADIGLAYTVSPDERVGRRLITAEVVVDGRSLGPVVEALVEIDEPSEAPSGVRFGTVATGDEDD